MTPVEARYLEALNADLGPLERYLLTSPVREPVAVDVPDAPGERLAWAPAPPVGRWRIVHLDASGVARVLAETPAPVRLRCRRALPPLLRAAGEAARQLLAALAPEEDTP